MTTKYPVGNHICLGAPARKTAPAAMAALLIAFAVASARANAATVGLGLDHESASDGARWSGMMGFLATQNGPAAVTLAVTRYSDGATGEGFSGFGDAVVALRGPWRLHGAASRAVADEGYRALYWKAGPVLALDETLQFGISYARRTDNQLYSGESAVAEAAYSVSPRVRLESGAGYGRSRDADGLMASAGATWAASSRLVFLTGLSVGPRTGAGAATSGGGSAGPPLLPSLPIPGLDQNGGADRSEPERQEESSIALNAGIRVLFP